MRFDMTGIFACSLDSRKKGPGRQARRRPAGLRLEGLETREMLTISPGQICQSATYFDGTGNQVDITVSGPVTDPLTQGFTVELAGLATDHADATTVALQGLGATNGLQVVVTPVQQPSAGPSFNNI